MNREAAIKIKKRATALKMAGDFQGALRQRWDLERVYDSIHASADEQASNLNFIAFLGVHTGNLAEAERAAKRCLELYPLITKKHPEKLATYLSMYAAVLATCGKFEEAAGFEEQAIIMFSESLGPADSFVEARRHTLQRMRLRDVGPYLDRS